MADTMARANAPGAPGSMSDLSLAVGVADVPDAILDAGGMEQPDYVDACVARTPRAGERSAEEWARAVLEQTPTGRRAPLLWHALGLRLGPRSPEYVQGWRIAERGDNWIRVQTSSWYMTGHAVALVGQDKVSIALFLRFDHPIAALIWLPIGALHRRGLPMMLRQAVRR